MVFESHFRGASRPKSSADSTYATSKDGNRTNLKNKQSNDSSGKSNINGKKSKKRTRPPKKKEDSSKRRKRAPPSEEALALSSQLKILSTQKRYQDALDLYWNEANAQIRDGHHACIVVDCCSRSGAVQEGEKVINFLKNRGNYINVETKTALLKGYAHSGMIHKAAQLYEEMESAKDSRDRPNVRTLNTLLRGCLWTAASAENSDRSNITGGVILSEDVWQWHKNQRASAGGSKVGTSVDSSSYEYSIALLCQALRTGEAASRIQEMIESFDIKKTQTDRGDQFTGEDKSVLESIAQCFLCLARSYSLLNRYDQAKKAAQNALNAASAFSSLDATDSEDNRKIVKGGKQAWKSRDDDGEVSRRSVSNTLFRAHRLGELQSEAKMILSVCTSNSKRNETDDFVKNIMHRLLYFSGGGTTDLSAGHILEEDRGETSNHILDTQQILTSLWVSFGLASAVKAAKPGRSFPSSTSCLSESDCKNILKFVGTDSLAIGGDGRIDFSKIFTKNSSKPATKNSKLCGLSKRPLNIELGAGFGDWAILQALSNPSSDYVAVELRSDRVWQMLTKGFLCNGASALHNLCSVGSECGSFLRDRVKPGTITNIFVNHPEPPTQTFGANASNLEQISEGGEEPAHMLNSQTLLSAAQCLDEASGQIVIVTDNQWYARLICCTFVKLIRMRPGLLRSKNFGVQSGMRRIEVFPPLSVGSQKVNLYEGTPGELIGHKTLQNQAIGTSYFDRLWRSGAGAHAETKKRFIIIMERRGASEPQNRTSNATVKQGEKERKKRKKSEAKQKRRNERRLLKRNQKTQDEG
mmetsp:Transcript_4080/g.5877  ORF Transcript_4080/g.5877 Transcript_4080/m.5877 type:complete len:811 (+) Transcript_4080:100-2532(+)